MKEVSTQDVKQILTNQKDFQRLESCLLKRFNFKEDLLQDQYDSTNKRDLPLSTLLAYGTIREKLPTVVSLEETLKEVEKICKREKIEFPDEINLLKITESSKVKLNFYEGLKKNNYKDSEGRTPWNPEFVDSCIETYSKEIKILKEVLSQTESPTGLRKIFEDIAQKENKRLECLKKVDPKNDPDIERKISVQRALAYHFSVFRDDVNKHFFLEQKINFLLSKVSFNLTKNPDYLNEFLPLRKYLSKNDHEKLKKYDELVKYLLSEVKLFYKEECIATQKDLKEIKADKPMDDFEKFMSLAPIVELFNELPRRKQRGIRTALAA